MKKILSVIWGSITGLLHLVGRIITVVLLTVVYVLVFVPLGLALQLLRRTPLIPKGGDGSSWHLRPQEDLSLEAARRPY